MNERYYMCYHPGVTPVEENDRIRWFTDRMDAMEEAYHLSGYGYGRRVDVRDKDGLLVCMFDFKSPEYGPSLCPADDYFPDLAGRGLRIAQIRIITGAVIAEMDDGSNWFRFGGYSFETITCMSCPTTPLKKIFDAIYYFNIAIRRLTNG